MFLSLDICITSLLILYMIYGLRTFWADENYSGFLMTSWFVQLLFSVFISSYFIAKIEFDQYIRNLEDLYEDLEYDRSMDYQENDDQRPKSKASREPESEAERIPTPEISKNDRTNILGEYVDYEQEAKKDMSKYEILAKLEKYAE